MALMVSDSGRTTKSGVGPSDSALVVAARAGEAWAQQALFMRHAGRMLGLAQHVLGERHDAEDLVQDAFVAALTNLAQLANPQAFAAWLGVLLVRLARKRLRRRRLLERLGLRTPESVDLDELIAPHAPPEVVSELRAVYGLLHRLSAEERIALVLRRIEGLELVEISERMRLSVATVKRRLKSADERLVRAKSKGNDELREVSRRA